MKKVLIIILGLIITTSVFARKSSGGTVSVHGYYKRNGTYVQSHHRTSPDGSKSNNWSHYGNVNPYTGKVGTNKDNSINYGGHYGGSGGRYYGGHYSGSSGGYYGGGTYNDIQPPVPTRVPEYVHLASNPTTYKIVNGEVHNIKSAADYD